MTVMVTGAIRSIGKAITQAFRARGDRVIGASRSEGFDVSREEDVERLFAGIAQLDVFVNPGGTRTAMRELAYPDEDPAKMKAPEQLAAFFVALAAGKIRCQPGESVDYERA